MALNGGGSSALAHDAAEPLQQRDAAEAERSYPLAVVAFEAEVLGAALCGVARAAVCGGCIE
eukprot:6178402-Pleurochrysis_carterae.AAC.1